MTLRGMPRPRHTSPDVGFGATVDGRLGGSKLRQMNLFRRSLWFGAALIGAACERAKAPVRADSTTAKPVTPVDSTTTVPPQSWDPSAGPLLLVTAESPSRAFVIVPDSASASAQLSTIPHPATVTLLGRGGTVQTADLPAVGDSGACVVATLNAAPPPRPWSIGFIGGVVSPLPMDSIQAFSAADSASLVATITRLASVLPNDSAGRFTGLPFVVRTAWRFTIPGEIQEVVGTLNRQINQEATPLQEHTLLIAERRLKGNDTSFSKVYSERFYGPEETIESPDVVAAALLGANRNAAIILSRDFGDATAYGLLERGDDGRWRARWTSARRHC
jgi:hypothetical protein